MTKTHQQPLILLSDKSKVLQERLSTFPVTAVLCCDSLYDQPEASPLLEKLRQHTGIFILVDDLPIRAMRAKMCDILREVLPTAEQATEKLFVFNFSQGEFRTVKSITEITGEGTGTPECVDFSEAIEPRWYPIVDKERCINCFECLNFCLFGVYGVDRDERLFTEQPDACRDGCPACARVCPTGAIMFAKHLDPQINGEAIPSGSEDITAAEARTRAKQEKEKHLDSLVDVIDQDDFLG